MDGGEHTVPSQSKMTTGLAIDHSTSGRDGSWCGRVHAHATEFGKSANRGKTRARSDATVASLSLRLTPFTALSEWRGEYKEEVRVKPSHVQ